MSDLGNDGNAENSSFIAQATAMITQYTRYNRGYLAPTPRNDLHNNELTNKYRTDPRVFWENPAHQPFIRPQLRECAQKIISIRSASSVCESHFSTMSHMISGRRSSKTAENACYRLTLRNQLPLKRKLESLMKERKIKKRKLFDTG